MAGLGMLVGIDYRPCFVNNKKQEIKALFHCWSHRSEVVGESALRGGHPGGQISATFAIVEYEDGSVHEVNPQNVRLVDGLINQYAFMEDLDESKNKV